MNQSRKTSSREAKKPKGVMSKAKPKTEYQKTRDAAKARKQKRGLAIFD
jgi:hypothetical protein